GGSQRGAGAVGPEGVGSEVEVGEVVDEKIEAVAGHEPTSRGGCVLVDGAGGAVAHREGCADGIRLVEVVVEEALRPEGRRRDPRNVRQVACAAAITGDVHGGA